MRKKKSDKYLKKRGGRAYFVDLSCAKCSAYIFLYQKDGDGQLKRCYLNRIVSPLEFEKLQHKKSGVPARLKCPSCSEVVGLLIKHHDGRPAFRLRQGYFSKRRHKD